jgi:hypothetical protein
MNRNSSRLAVRFETLLVEAPSSGKRSPQQCLLLARSRHEAMSALTSAFGGKADIDSGLRDVCL